MWQLTFLRLLALGYNLDWDLHIFHFFLCSISPENVSILLVDGISLIDRLRQLEPKFMVSFQILNTKPSHYGDNSILFFRDMMNPPAKCWFMLNALLWHIWQPGLCVIPQGWIASPMMWIRLSICNKCPNKLLTF